MLVENKSACRASPDFGNFVPSVPSTALNFLQLTFSPNLDDSQARIILNKRNTRDLKMLTSGLTNAPLTKALLIYTIASSIALSLFDIKHLVVIYVSPHFWPYVQFWRALVWHVVGFTNSTEALFAAMLVYHLRVVERAWGKRKMAVSSSLSYCPRSCRYA